MMQFQKLCYFIALSSLALPLYAFDTSQKAFSYLKKQQTASIEKRLTQEEKILLKEIQATKTEDIITFLEEVSFSSSLTPQEGEQRIQELSQKVQDCFQQGKKPFYKHFLAFIKKHKKTCIGGICIYLLLLVILRMSRLEERLIFQGKKITREEAEKDIQISASDRASIRATYNTDLSVEIKPYHTEDGTTLYGIYYKHQKATNTQERKVIFYCHGNSGTAFDRHTLARDIAILTGCDLFLASYPGYGINEGEITSPKEFYDAAESSFTYLTKSMDNGGLGYQEKNTILLGCSLGSGAAIHIAAQSKYKLAALCLACPLLSVPDMVKSVKMIVRPFLRYTINNGKKIKKVQCPILIAHDEKDDVIPFFHGKELYKIAVAKNNTRPDDEKIFIRFIDNYHGGHHIDHSFMVEMGKIIQSLRL